MAALVAALTAKLQQAPEPEKSQCALLLEEWLTKGVADSFHSLRTTLRTYSQMSLAQVHRREADALEYTFGEEWLLAMLLRSMVATMIQEGVLHKKPPSQECPVCSREFVESKSGDQVHLVCFLPCSHWMDADCWEAWRAAKGGDDDYCPSCNGVRRATVVKTYRGRMELAAEEGDWYRRMRRLVAGR